MATGKTMLVLDYSAEENKKVLEQIRAQGLELEHEVIQNLNLNSNEEKTNIVSFRNNDGVFMSVTDTDDQGQKRTEENVKESELHPMKEELKELFKRIRI